MFAYKERRLSPLQYLEQEYENDIRHEYMDGYVYMMAGAQPAHHDITENIGGLLFNQLRRNGCHYATEKQLVLTGDGNYYYPDAYAMCGERLYTHDPVPVLTNFTLIVEVFSRTSRAFDAGEKFRRYQTTPSLREYLLVAQEQVYVEHHIRGDDGAWSKAVYAEKDETVRLVSVPASLSLSDLYYGVL
jgi:Uma2 family endonuclease